MTSPPTQSSYQSKIALFPWGDLIEDYLDSINISFNSFCNEMTGGWLFGYVEALKQVNIQTVIVCISARVNEPNHYRHKPTGAKICVLPSPTPHRWMRQFIVRPYAGNLDEMFGSITLGQRFFFSLLRDIISYCANPLEKIAQELRREGCRAILCQEYEYPRFDLCIALGKWLNIPVYATFQGGNFQLSRIERFIRPYSLRSCSGFIVPTSTEIQRLKQQYSISPERVAQIFNPIDMGLWQQDKSLNTEALRYQVRTQLGIPLDAKIVIYHGRIELHRKGLDVLMDSWAMLCHDYPDQEWWLLLVGTGNDTAELENYIAALPKQTVRWVNEYILEHAVLRNYLGAADLYVLPSRHEGFPVAPLEAMTCGLPIIASDAPGVPDILEEGELSGGVLIPRGQSKVLAAELARILDDELLRARLADNALRRIQSSFSLRQVGKQLKQVFMQSEQ